MIIPCPSDSVLLDAHVVALFDPKHASWYVTLQNELRSCSPKEAVLVEIPVDSSVPGIVERWRQKLSAVRAAEMTPYDSASVPSSD
jgi:hypothetical protein